MKRFIAIFSFFILTINTFADDKFLADSAQMSFMQSNYSQALVYYDSLLQSGYSSSDLYYNIGNCYYQLNDFANAIYYYEKSLLRNPANQDAQINLQIANQFLKQKIEPLQKPFYVVWYQNVCSVLTADAWAIFSIIVFVLTLAFIALWLFNRKIIFQKTSFIFAVLCFLIFIFSAICAYQNSANISDNGYAIVMKQSMVKTSPNAEALNSFEICEGLKVALLDSANNKAYIRLQDGKEGWINYADLKLLSE